MKKERKGFVTVHASAEFIARLRTYCRVYKQGIMAALIFLAEEGMDRRRIVADPLLLEEENRRMKGDNQ